MISIPIAWKILRDLGPSWVLKRIAVEAQVRLGIVERRLPVADWEFESRDWLLADAPRSADAFKASLLQRSRFFIDSKQLPRSSDPDVCRRAERVLQGDWPYFSHTCFKVGFPPDWHRNPFDGTRFDDRAHWTRIAKQEKRGFSDIKFVWETSRFSAVYVLVRAYGVARDERFAEAFWQLIEDWADKNHPNRGVNWASGQESAVRVMAWCFGLYAFLDSPSGTAERVFNLVRMIEKHGERIAGFIDYALSQRNNHGISEAVGLFTIGTLFPQLRRAAEWQRHGRELMIRQLREQVYEDGSHIQHSFNYERVLIDAFSWAFRLGELNGCRFPDESYEIVERTVEFMLRFCDSQSGRMPNHGGNDGSLVFPLSACDYLDFRPSLQAAHYLIHHYFAFPAGRWDEAAEWICAVSNTGDATHLERIGAAGRDAACCVSTIDSSARGSGYLKMQGRASYAMLRAARYRVRPAQADQLHFDLWWRGENIACDAGTYLYNGAMPWKNALAATSVHNTVTIGHRDQMTRAGRFLWLDWAQAQSVQYRVGELATAVEAWHDGYKKLGIVHKRAVLNIEDCWIVVDDLSGSFNGEARLHWVFPDCELAWEQDESRLWMQTAAGPFQCCLHIPGASSVSLARAGKILAEAGNEESDEHLQIRGWHSLYYGEKTPALSLAAECRLPIRFITVLAPAEVVLTKIEDVGLQLRVGKREFIVVLNPRGSERTFLEARG